MSKQIGGFDNIKPAKGSFAARVARANNVESNSVDESELTEQERTALRKADAIDKASAGFKFVPPEQAIERVEIIFDNSGSMSGDKIRDAREGVTEFMKACLPNETAVRITPVDTHYDPAIKFTTNLPKVAESIKCLDSNGGTPLYDKLLQALKNDARRNDLKPSRIIAFSDGQAGDGHSAIPARESDDYWLNRSAEPASETHIEVVKLAKEFGICIDTCFIAESNETDSKAYYTMKALAEETGGIFILFEKGKCDFKRGFKYLTKGNRLLLADKSFKAKLEAGQI